MPRPSLDELESRMRASWEANAPLRVWDLLATDAALGEDEVLLGDLLALDFDLAAEHGTATPIEEYCARFPERAEEVEIVLTIHRAFEHVGPEGAGGDTPLPTLDDWSHPPGFSLRDRIGQSKQAVVYLAHDEAVNRLVVVKTTRDAEARDPEAAARLRREAQALGRVAHANVVPLYAVGNHAGRPYLVLRWCEEGSLPRHLCGDRLSPRDAAVVVATLARAVEAVHRCGFIHRDLKPSNVLLANSDPEGPEPLDSRANRLPRLDVLLCDFGLSCRDKESEPGGGLVGTLPYMAPEQARREAVGLAADVYGLGAVLYERLTGVPPYQGKSVADTVELVLKGDLVRPREREPKANIPRDLDAVCLKALARQSEKRYRSALALAEDLNRFLTGRPTEARPPNPLRRFGMWCGKNPWVVTAVAVLCLLLLLTSSAAVLAVGARNAAEVATHAERVERARRLLETGALDHAAGAFDAAIADGRDDRAGLELERTRCRYRAGDRERLGAELRQAWESRDRLNPRARTLLLLYRAEYELTAAGGDGSSARRWLAEIAEDRALSDAERLYVRGLAESNSPRACDAFRQALAHSPTHHRARASLVMLLLFLGRVEEARAHADVLRRALPDHPVPPFADAWSDLLTRDRPRGKKVQPQEGSALSTGVDAGQAADLRRFLEFSDELMDHFALLGLRFQEGAGLRKWSELRPSLFRKLDELKRLSRSALAAFDYGPVAADRTLANWQLVVEVNDPTAWTRTLMLAEYCRGIGGLRVLRPIQRLLTRGMTARRLREAADRHPDQLLSISEMIVTTMEMAWDLFVWKDRFALRATGKRLAADMGRASDGPAAFPRGPFRYQAQVFGIMWELGYREDIREMNSALAQLGGVGAAASPLGPGPLLALGGLPRWEDEAHRRSRADSHEQLLLLAVEGRNHPPARQELIPRLCRRTLFRYDPELARPLLADWQADQPDHALPVILLGELELRLGNREKARELATRVLHREPRNADAQRLEALTPPAGTPK